MFHHCRNLFHLTNHLNDFINFVQSKHSKNQQKKRQDPNVRKGCIESKKAEMRLNIEILPQELKKWDEKMMRFSDRKCKPTHF